MIWVAWRRHRVMLAIVGGLLIALAVWMVVIEHGFHTAAVLSSEDRCPVGVNHLRNLCTGNQTQATVIELILLALPCAVGVVLGGPLIAGELHGNTNRLAWTQGISRTRWFLTKWILVAFVLLISTALLQVLINWWRSRVDGVVGYGLGLTGFGGPGSGRLQPGTFAMTGIVPVAYALFAFALAATLGAVFRRTSWAIAGTVVLYAGASLLMVFLIRPNVLPQSFTPFGTSAGTTSTGGASAFLQTGNAELTTPWFISFGYRYDPGVEIPPGAPSASAVGQQCEDRNYNYTPFLTCLSNHHVQEGQFVQPARHYWPLQWIEGGIYAFASVLLFGAGLWSVRRWRA